MKTHNALLAVVLSAIAFTSTPVAADSAISAKIGSLGIGGEFTFRLSDDFNARAGLNRYDYDFALDIDNTRVDAVLALESIPLLLDYHPFSTGFRISAGAMVNGNAINLSANPDEMLVLNGIPFEIDSMQGEIKFSKFAPYIGIGVGNAVLAGSAWQFTCDLGVMFHGKPKATASAVAANPLLQPLVEMELNEEVESFNSDVKGYTIWPVVSVGISLNY